MNCSFYFVLPVAETFWVRACVVEDAQPIPLDVIEFLWPNRNQCFECFRRREAYSVCVVREREELELRGNERNLNYAAEATPREV